jgi:peptide/nickel transport system permease protein
LRVGPRRRGGELGRAAVLRLIARRLLLAIPLVFVVSMLTFVLGALTPGDPAATILGATATKAQLAALDRQLGFDQPLYTQYWHWLEHAVRGDFGTSLLNGQSVVSQLTARLPATLSLVIGATLLSALIGVSLGIFSAIRSGASGRITDALAMLGFAIPTFWLGLVLVEIFAIRAQLLPATGYVSFGQSPSGWLKSLILPVITLAVAGVTGIAKQTRDSMRDVLSREYIDALRADGIAERRIIFVHALRNASIPVVTMVGTFFVGLLSGALLVESVFAMPGVGSLAVTATSGHDLSVVQGIAVLFCLIVVVVNLLVDLAYGWLNPRARLG